MRKAWYFRITSLLLVSTINLQAVTPTQLNSYFTRFKRGLNCLIKRKPCTAEDKKAVYQAGGALLTLLGVIAVSKFVHTHRSKFGKIFLTPEEKEILTFPLNQQQTAKDEKLLEAVENGDLHGVTFWLTKGANPNAYFEHKYQVITPGKSIIHSGHILNTAIKKASLEDLEEKKRRSKIILALFAAGADATLKANLYWNGEILQYPIGYLHVYSEAQTPYKSDAVEKILRKAAEPYRKQKEEIFFKSHPEARDLIK